MKERMLKPACFREMREEIGTDKADILSIHPDWLNYDIPLPLADRLWGGSYRGQSQKVGSVALYWDR
jgi:putative (di)nucleoside polyphosphate hydrolase